MSVARPHNFHISSHNHVSWQTARDRSLAKRKQDWTVKEVPLVPSKLQEIGMILDIKSMCFAAASKDISVQQENTVA